MLSERAGVWVIEFQATRDFAILKNGNCDQRLDAAPAALFSIESFLVMDVGATEHLAGLKAREAQRLFHGNLGSRRQRQPKHCSVPDSLAVEKSNHRAAGPCDLGQAL